MSENERESNPLPGNPGTVLIAAAEPEFARLIENRLERLEGNPEIVLNSSWTDPSRSFDLAIIAPGGDRRPGLSELDVFLKGLAARSTGKVVLVSSAAIYGPDHHSPGFVTELRRRSGRIRNCEVDWWSEVERLVENNLGKISSVEQVVLRPAFTAGLDGGKIFDPSRSVTWRIGGYDPPMQFLDTRDLADAVAAVCQPGVEGVFNVAPADAVPFRVALRYLGIRSFPLPRLLLRLFRPAAVADERDYFCHPWTVSAEKLAKKSGFRIGNSSRDTLRKLKSARRNVGWDATEALPEFDRHGLDEHYIARRGKTLFRFLETVYWRIERRGFEHIPRDGPAIVVGPHRGFMPFDAIMLVHLIFQYAGRTIRFLTHPTLFKFPVQAPFFRRLGGILACRKNAEATLKSGEVIGILPEGIRGAFRMYRDAYDFSTFGRPDYIRLSLKHGVPVIPYAIVGSAEIFPILGRIDWSWFKRFMEWPFLPITPTFPFLPVPLPTKWHIRILPPVEPGEVAAEARRTGRNPEELFAERVRKSIDAATGEMRANRRSIFRGSVFTGGDPS